MLLMNSKLNIAPLLSFPRELESRLESIIKETAVKIQDNSKREIMTGPKSGRIYHRGEHRVSFKTSNSTFVSFIAKRGSRAKSHQASAPGQAPATDYGNLVNSHNVMPRSKFIYWVTVAAKHAKALEHGTPRIAPRPFLRPASDKERPEFMPRVKKATRDAMNKARRQI